MPPVSTTHSFGDIATATRIESMANTISVSSTFTTVAQNAREPSHGRRRRAMSGAPRAAAAGRNAGTAATPDRAPPSELHQRQLDHVRRQEDRHAAEQEGADNAVAERLLLLVARQAEHQDREDHRVVGAQKPFEQDEEGDGDEVGRREPGPGHREAAGSPTENGRHNLFSQYALPAPSETNRAWPRNHTRAGASIDTSRINAYTL